MFHVSWVANAHLDILHVNVRSTSVRGETQSFGPTTGGDVWEKSLQNE